jgi:hypothetical protein
MKSRRSSGGAADNWRRSCTHVRSVACHPNATLSCVLETLPQSSVPTGQIPPRSDSSDPETSVFSGSPVRISIHSLALSRVERLCAEALSQQELQWIHWINKRSLPHTPSRHLAYTLSALCSNLLRRPHPPHQTLAIHQGDDRNDNPQHGGIGRVPQRFLRG